MSHIYSGQITRPLLCGVVFLAATLAVAMYPRSAFADSDCTVIPVDNSDPGDDIVPFSTFSADEFATDPAPYLIYLNRTGGTFTHGKRDNASQNISSIAPGEVIIPPWNRSDADWEDLVECVQDRFSQFINIQFTTQDPQGAPHLEAVIGGKPSHFEEGKRVGGIAPIANNCSVIRRAVVYVFEQNLSTVKKACEITAHEVAHAFGNDHVLECTDPMSYKGGCGDKTFQDIDSACGEFDSRKCHCGNEIQNSFQNLASALGAHNIEQNGGCNSLSAEPGIVVLTLFFMGLLGRRVNCRFNETRA